MPSQLIDLLKERAGSPRAALFRSPSVENSAGVDASIKHLTDDLELILNQLSRLSDGSTPQSQEWIDLRITAEHMLLLTAQIFPVVARTIADLYMTDVSDLDVPTSNPPRSLTNATENTLATLKLRWDSIQTTGDVEVQNQLRKVIEAGVILALFAETLTRLLHQMLLGGEPIES